eukprot:366227-Chlamydomonas_euryale.AAC.34
MPPPPRQVVVAMDSPLVGRSVRESRFRTKYNAAIVGVHRRGKRLRTKIGDIVLTAGDVLLLDAGETFLETHGDSNAFSLISEVWGARQGPECVGCVADL